VQRFLPELAPALDNELSSVFALTYRTFGAEAGVDTQPFRSGVWHYVMRLFGVCNDDFPYDMINDYVPREIKAFAKKVACLPWIIRPAAFEGFSEKLTSAERVHVIMLAAEGRKLASTLSALRAVHRHFRSR